MLYSFVGRSFLIFTNSIDPDEMQHDDDAAFHLGLHCLQKYLFRGDMKVYIGGLGIWLAQ